METRQYVSSLYEFLRMIGELMVVNNVLNNQQITNSTSTVKESKQTEETSFDTYLDEATTEKTVVSLNDLFEKAAQTYNVPVNLLKAIGYAESSFRADATSHCGAQGIMQLMPATAKSLGVTDAYDPEQNIMGGAKYISQMLEKYDGDVSLALAAYNAGSGNVAKYGGIPPFKETQNYVVKVTGYMKQELDADQRVVIGGSGINSVDKNYTPVFEEVSDADLVSVQDKWDEIFSYDSYEILLKVLKADEDSQQQEEQQKEQQQDSTLSQISMNPSVVNLLKSANISLG